MRVNSLNLRDSVWEDAVFGIRTFGLLAQKNVDIKKQTEWKFPEAPTLFLNFACRIKVFQKGKEGGAVEVIRRKF